MTKILTGKDFNFFARKEISATSFADTEDFELGFPPNCVTFINESQDGQNHSIEYSFNGNTVHGDLIPGTPCASLIFQNRMITKIWFRLKSGSNGTPSVRIEAWGR